MYPSVDWKTNYNNNKNNNNNNNNNNPIVLLHLHLSDDNRDIPQEQLAQLLFKEFPQGSIKVTTGDGVSFTLTNPNHMVS